jgi:membrane associated rhomboid family serine protease
MIPIHDDNPTDITPVMTVGIMLVCIWAFIWQLTLGEHGFTRAVYAFGLIPGVLTGHAALPAALDLIAPPWTLMTSIFLHGGFLHLAGNVLYLWVFGNNVEDALGHGRFVAFFFICGACAALVQTVEAPQSVVPMIGASGAVSGILGAYLLLHPRTSVLVVLPLGFILYPVRLPAAVLLILWFAVQIVSSVFTDPTAPGVAWHAHIGGFVVGAILTPFMKRPNVPLLR